MLKTVTNSINASQIQTPITLPGNVTLSTGNLIIGTSGKGIDFSATPNTGTSELLSDYEEGTWTPDFSSWSTAPTSATAQYTKTGRCVVVSIVGFQGICAAGSSIGGLPFTSGQGGGAALCQNLNTNSIGFTGLILDNRSSITNLSAAALSTSYWAMSATYFV